MVLDYTKMFNEWQDAVKTLSDAKMREMELRKILFNAAFPNPEEGVQRVDLMDGGKLKGTYKLNRKIDVDALDKIPDRLKQYCIKYKPELDIKEYRKLSREDTIVFDTCLTVTPGAPSLEVERPGEKKKK